SEIPVPGHRDGYQSLTGALFHQERRVVERPGHGESSNLVLERLCLDGQLDLSELSRLDLLSHLELILELLEGGDLLLESLAGLLRAGELAEQGLDGIEGGKPDLRELPGPAVWVPRGLGEQLLPSFPVLVPRVEPESTVLDGDQRSLLHVASTPLLLSDRKSTRLNSSHVKISYSVFCLAKNIRY